MKSTKYIFLLALVLLMVEAKAQQQPVYTQYALNPFVINPAYAGQNEALNITAAYRQQWTSVEGAPRTMNFSGHMPIQGVNSGVGLVVWSDRIGKTSQTSISGAYSYKIKMDIGVLSAGLSLGLQQLKTDYAASNLNGVVDPTFASGDINQWKFNTGAGVFLAGDKYFVGFSIPQMLSNQFSNESGVEQIRTTTRYYLTGGYIIDLGASLFSLKPYVMLNVEDGGPFNYDINLQAYYNEQFSLGLQYKSTNALALLIELVIDKTTYVGYSHDFSFGKSFEGIYTGGSHEFVVSFLIPWKKGEAEEVKFKYY